MQSENENWENAVSCAMVDAHCHIDLYPNPQEVLAAAEAGKVYTIAVTNAPSVFHYTATLSANCRYVRAAAGLHPQLVHSHAGELEQLWSLLDRTRYVGEVGLDYQTPIQTERQAQRRVFSKILERCAAYGNKVITVHSRRAAADVIAAVGENYLGGSVILHWFSGTTGELEKAIQCGIYFSVNMAMTSSRGGQKLIQGMPIDRVVTETDGPFVKVSQEAASPSDVSTVVFHLARIWGLSVEEAGNQIISNFRRLVEASSHRR
jgi:TatD DNase family protein